MQQGNNWSHRVTKRPPATFPPAGLYTKRAREIYLTMRRPDVSPNGIASAIQMTQFFINRAGRKMDEKQKKQLEKAIELLRVELTYLKQRQEFDLQNEPKPVFPPPEKRIGGYPEDVEKRERKLRTGTKP